MRNNNQQLYVTLTIPDINRLFVTRRKFRDIYQISLFLII